MAEGTKLRLVRCPKCDNLLPELRAYSVYQCGGCGTALQVQMRSSATDGSSVKSNDEERINLGSEMLEGGGEIFDGVEVRELGDREENSNGNCSSSSKTENVEERMDNMGKWRRDRGGSVEQESGIGTHFRRLSKAPVDNYISEDEQRVNNRKEIGDIIPQLGTMSLAPRPEQVPYYHGVERDGTMAYGRPQRNVAQVPRFSKSTYADEGPSNYQPPSFHYGYGEPVKNQNNLDVPARMEYLEQDRAELLRQLEELKDQLIRSDVSGKPKERAPINGRVVSPDPYGGGHENWMPESSSESNRALRHAFLQDEQVRRPPYFNRSHGHASMMNRNDMDFHKPYPQTRPSHEIPRYGDNFGPQIHERVPNQLPRRYPEPQSHDYYYDQYMGVDPDPVLSHRNNAFFHHPTCSCFHCYNKQWQMPHHAPSTVVRNRRIPDAPTNGMYYHDENSGIVGPRGYNPQGVNHPPLHSYEPRPLLRRPNELDAAGGGCIRNHAEKEGLTKKNARHCNPIAGGAPFITCCNCFKLLQLPRKFLLIKKNQWKLQCGACSTVMQILMENKRLVISVSAETKESPSQVTGASVEVIKEEGPLQSKGHPKRSSANSYSDDFGNSGYSYESLEPEHVPVLSAIDKRVNLKDYEKMQETSSSPSSVTEGEESPDSVIVRRELSRSAELLVKESVTPPLPGSPLLEHFEYSSYQRQVTKLGKGSKSKRMDQEEAVLAKASSRHDSLKDASTATEMEVSFNEYSNTVTSQDSEDISKEEDRPRIRRGVGSFFLGLKNSLRDISVPTQVEENDEVANVSVNEHPIPDSLVKKAEKRAGKILPGQYWYDFRAGFWGVMGQRCLGVIPPCIEEFNFPMPKDCAGGTTGVFVNGRELHQKDLDLLASRGLPTARDKSYIIEISGRVLDEDTGEELDGLGKLAPTIEKLKHGFGMRVPGVAA